MKKLVVLVWKVGLNEGLWYLEKWNNSTKKRTNSVILKNNISYALQWRLNIFLMHNKSIVHYNDAQLS